MLTDYPQNAIKLAEGTPYELRFERLPTEDERKVDSLTHVQDVTNNLILHNPSSTEKSNGWVWSTRCRTTGTSPKEADPAFDITE